VERVGDQDRLVQLGITCALCHSTVANSFLPGIGRRLDGWPNRALDVGAIVALTPAQRAVHSSWGPGKYDPRFNIDGKNTPLVLPSWSRDGKRILFMAEHRGQWEIFTMTPAGTGQRCLTCSH